MDAVDVVRTIGGLAAAFLVAGALGACSYVAALRLCPRGSPSERLSAAGIVAVASLVLVFELLTAVGLFRLGAILVLSAAGLLVAGARPVLAREAARRARADLSSALAALSGAGDRLTRLASLAVLALAASRLARGLASPPLGYDALTYHLARAATWIQAATQQRFLAPDAWDYTTFYPAAGDALWAFAMMPTGSDLLLAPAGALAWAAVLLGTHASARALGATPRAAVLSALAVGALPCVLPHLSAAYVDLPALAGLLNAFAQFAFHARDGGRARAVLSVLALAVAAAIRSSALPWLAAGVATIAVVEAFRAGPAADRVRTVVACLLAALLVVPTYVGIWADTGSPFYPMEVRLPGVGTLPGNPEFLAIHSGEGSGLPPIPAAGIARALFLPDLESTSPHLNLGPAAPLLLVLGALGAFRLVRRGPRSPAVLGLLVIAAVVSGTFLWGGAAGFLRVPWWLDKVGRFLVPGLAIAIVLGSVVGGRVADAVRFAGIAAGAGLSFPLGWSDPNTHATLLVLAVLVPAIALAVASARVLARRGHPLAAGLATAALLLGATAILPAARGPARYPTWEAASRGEAWDLHPGNRRCLSAWPIWEALDGPEPTRVALAAGFDGIGHNWYTYPLFGSRLQNPVAYVPVTRSGRVLDYADPGPVEAQADLPSWLSRLDAGGFEALVTLWPDPPEARWAEGLPDVFRPFVTTPGGTAWRLDRDALRRRLAQGGPNRATLPGDRTVEPP